MSVAFDAKMVRIHAISTEMDALYTEKTRIHALYEQAVRLAAAAGQDPEVDPHAMVFAQIEQDLLRRWQQLDGEEFDLRIASSYS